MSTAPSPEPAEKPTHARYYVVVFAVTLAVLSYIDRVAISKAAPVSYTHLDVYKRQLPRRR